MSQIIQPFVPFRKIPRLRREIIVTEKIDGTNACVYVPEDKTEPLVAGKRSAWIAPGPTDNHHFAMFVELNEDALRGLGPGVHFGEWWGKGINRRYPDVEHKRFSLFNTERWRRRDVKASVYGPYGPEAVEPPECCDVVPVLARFDRLDDKDIQAILDALRVTGSIAAPGCFKPEGIVVYHTASKSCFKVTLEKDDAPKGMEET